MNGVVFYIARKDGSDGSGATNSSGVQHSSCLEQTCGIGHQKGIPSGQSIDITDPTLLTLLLTDSTSEECLVKCYFNKSYWNLSVLLDSSRPIRDIFNYVRQKRPHLAVAGLFDSQLEPIRLDSSISSLVSQNESVLSPCEHRCCKVITRFVKFNDIIVLKCDSN